MDYLDSVIKGEEKLREIELDASKWGPPEGMDDQAWMVDRAYLLYMMRLYARKLYYSKWSRPEEIKLIEEDFAAMHHILERRAGSVKKEMALQAYHKVIGMLQLAPEDIKTPVRIEKALMYVVNASEQLDQEDYVHLVSYLAGYAKDALNKGRGNYAAIALICQIPPIEGKYGKNWPGTPALPYRTLTNLACSAMNLHAAGGWRALKMELVRDVGKDGTVYVWIEELLKAYASRLEEKFRNPSLAYVRARAAFFRKDYEEAAEQLKLIGSQPYEFFGHSIRQLRLMTYYELMYCQIVAKPQLARQLEPNPRATISNMRSNIKYTDKGQERKTYQLDYYKIFTDGFSTLLHLKEQAEKLPVGSTQRFSTLHKAKPDLIKSLTGPDLFTMKWLRRQAYDLH